MEKLLFQHYWQKISILCKNALTKLFPLYYYHRIKNVEGFTALEVCNNEETCKLLTETINKTPPQGIPPVNLVESSTQAPPNTPITMGWLYKTGPLIFNIKKRFFVLDPYDGTFIRFQNQEDYPLKPRSLK